MRKGSREWLVFPLLPPMSLLVITSFSWDWPRVLILGLLEMLKFLLEDGGHNFFFSLLLLAVLEGCERV